MPPLLCLIALLAIGVPALLVHLAPPMPRALMGRVARRMPPAKVISATELPAVEAVSLVDLTPDEARAYNASVPFADGPNPPARAFRFAGAADDLERARDCLATAELYEAGSDAQGWKAVAQVVLNRVRHGAFPHTVCGVVFQGSERRTGCQFSFTCDGAMDRWHPLPDSWTSARAIAAQALGGAVFRPVGLATHYHTQAVVPYWQSSLDKIAAIGPHLFFRWTGWWGTPAAFEHQPAGAEPVIAAMAALSGTPTALPATVAAVAPTALTATRSDPDSFLVTLPAVLAPEDYPAIAANACGDRPRCRFSAWTARADTPTALPLAPGAVASMAFAYLRDRDAGIDKPLWNCTRTARAAKSECMKVQPALAVVSAPLPAPTPSAGTAKPSGELEVARRAAPAPTQTPLPSMPSRQPDPGPPRAKPASSDGA